MSRKKLEATKKIELLTKEEFSSFYYTMSNVAFADLFNLSNIDFISKQAKKLELNLKGHTKGCKRFFKVIRRKKIDYI